MRRRGLIFDRGCDIIAMFLRDMWMGSRVAKGGRL
jgi:hypothetical protein